MIRRELTVSAAALTYALTCSKSLRSGAPLLLRPPGLSSLDSGSVLMMVSKYATSRARISRSNGCSRYLGSMMGTPAGSEEAMWEFPRERGKSGTAHRVR